MAPERDGEAAGAARDGRSRNAANDAKLDVPCESVSTLVAMVTGGRARARTEWRCRERGGWFSVARVPRLGRFSRKRSSGLRARSTPPGTSLESHTVHRPTRDFKPRASRQRYFSCTPKGDPHCPPRFGRGSSPPTRRDGVEVGPETRDRGVRRGDARPRRRQRARAPGRSHREQVRRACVTKDTAELAHRARPNRRRARPFPADPRARDPRRAARLATAEVSVDARGRSRGPRPRGRRLEPIARRRSGQYFFVLSRATRASRPLPERRLGELDERGERAPKRPSTCAFIFSDPRRRLAPDDPKRRSSDTERKPTASRFLRDDD